MSMLMAMYMHMIDAEYFSTVAHMHIRMSKRSVSRRADLGNYMYMYIRSVSKESRPRQYILSIHIYIYIYIYIYGFYISAAARTDCDAVDFWG